MGRSANYGRSRYAISPVEGVTKCTLFAAELRELAKG
jgi:hypothetical protein